MNQENTGRLQAILCPAARRVAYRNGGISRDDVPVLKRHWQIHQAHALMLIESGIEAEAARRVLEALTEQENNGFTALMGRLTPRGLYLACESWLFEAIGPAAGVLHTGRSRNDLNATEQRLAARAAWRTVTGQLLRLAQTMALQARRYRDVPMPLHTHYQPAVISTYGHWLAGCAEGILRLHARALAELPHLNLCPMGAAAIGGTSHPINPGITAQLLGFAQPCRNSVDAIAAKDHLLAMMGLAVGAAHLISRIVQDYRFRTSSELGWFFLPDQLTGGSSVLPQKKNPWLLELAIARLARVYGSQTSFYVSSFAEPHTNTIPAGAEALGGLEQSIQGLSDAILLLRLHVRYLEPRIAILRTACCKGYPFAQALAEELARRGRTARAAHHEIGALIRQAVEGGSADNEPLVAARFLDPDCLAYGGGAGGSTSADSPTLEDLIISQSKLRQSAIAQWKRAREDLYARARNSPPP